MGLLDSIRNIMTIPDDDELEEETVETEERASEEPRKRETAVKRGDTPRIIGGKGKTVSFQQPQMHIVLAKPDHFEEVRGITDHLKAGRTVVLNLEAADRETARRIMDFLTGAAYAVDDTISRASNSTFMIAPNNVDVSGESVLDELDEGQLYF